VIRRPRRITKPRPAAAERPSEAKRRAGRSTGVDRDGGKEPDPWQVQAECQVVGCEWWGWGAWRSACMPRVTLVSDERANFPRSGIRDSSVGLGRDAASCGEAVLTEGQECRGLDAVTDEGVLSRRLGNLSRSRQTKTTRVGRSGGGGVRDLSAAATQSPRGGGRAAGAAVGWRRATAVTGGASKASGDWHEVARRAAADISRRRREWQAASGTKGEPRSGESTDSEEGVASRSRRRGRG